VINSDSGGVFNISVAGAFKNGFPLQVFNYHQPDDVFHCHDFYELVMVRKGSGYHVLDKESCRVGRGDIFLIRPGQVHTYRDVAGLEIVNMLYMPEQLDLPIYDLKDTFGYYVFFEAESKMSGRTRNKGRLSFTHEQLRQAEEIIAGMILEQQRHDPGFEFYLRVLFLRLIGLICRSFSEVELGESSELACVSRVIRFFEQNYQRTIRLADAARAGGKSSSTIVRLFRESFDYSPIEYLINLRLEKAAILLHVSLDSISEIAFSVGFEDSNYFSKMFSRKYGMSPRAYRKLERRL